MRNFKKYVVWQHGVELVTDVYKLVDLMPKAEMYCLSQQMRRAALSIPSNIAEGTGRESQKEFKRFIEISLSSAFELETQMIVSDNLFKLKSSELFDKTYDLLNVVQKELNALLTKLK